MPLVEPYCTVTSPAPLLPLTVAPGAPTRTSSYPSPLKSLLRSLAWVLPGTPAYADGAVAIAAPETRRNVAAASAAERFLRMYGSRQ